MIEFDRPTRKTKDGAKSDTLDAVRAAREMLGRKRLSVPRRRPATEPSALPRRHHQATLRPATLAYIARRVAEGRTEREAIRCIKRYLARRVWRHLEHPKITA